MPKDKMEKIFIEDIEVEVIRKRIRNIYISISSSTGAVKVSAPGYSSVKDIERFLFEKLKWIKKHRSKILTKPRKIKNSFVSGEKIELFGKKYTLNVLETSSKPKVFLNFDSIDMYIKKGMIFPERQKLMDKFYASKLEEIVPEYLKKWQKKIGIKVEKSLVKSFFQSLFNEIKEKEVVINKPITHSFRRMKSRWGSCHITDKKIVLNTELAKKSLRCIEYVTAHETFHFKERKHNQRFKSFMEKSFADWKKLEEELKIID